MALTRQQKTDRLSDLESLISDAKIVVFASYKGLTVGESQTLRQLSEDNGCTVRVAKNRLVKIALKNATGFKEADTNILREQLVYGFSANDEVAPAQTFFKFQKEHTSLNLLGAIDNSGKLFSEEEVKQLAMLPSKDMLHAQVVGTIAAPLSGFVNVLAGNMRGLINVINARIAQN